MKKKLMGLALIIFVFVVTATRVYASTFTYINIEGLYNYDEANKQLELVNNERKNNKVTLLEMDYELTRKAQERAREVALYFSHTRTNGESVLRSMNLNAENIAAGSTSAEGVTKQWMNSTGHKANILDNRMKSIGIASFTTSNGVTYWVEVFSTKRASNTKLFKGRENLSSKVKIKSDYIKKIRIFDFQINKKIKLGEDLTITNLQLRNEGWDSVYTTIDNSNAMWFSSNLEVATIDKNGKIVSLKEGKTTITATIQNVSINYEISVMKETKVINIEKISMSDKNLKLFVGETFNLFVSYYPTNANTDRTLTWESTNEKIVKVNKNGSITALSSGKASIVARTKEGFAAVCEVIVEEKDKEITNIILDNTTNTLSVGSTWKINAIVFPSNTTEKVLYKSSNNKIATIDNNGNIKALNPGEVIITVYSKNISKTFKINIKDNNSIENEKPKTILIDGVTLNSSEITLKVGEKFQFKYSLSPDNTTEEANATWTWTDYRIATLDSKGLLTARQAGEGEVIVIVGKNNVVARCKVKVVPVGEVEALSFRFSTNTIRLNEARKLDIVITPSTAAVNNSLKFTSSNPSVLTVDQNGIIRSQMVGTALITVTSPNGVSTSRLFTVSE